MRWRWRDGGPLGSSAGIGVLAGACGVILIGSAAALHEPVRFEGWARGAAELAMARREAESYAAAERVDLPVVGAHLAPGAGVGVRVLVTETDIRVDGARARIAEWRRDPVAFFQPGAMKHREQVEGAPGQSVMMLSHGFVNRPCRGSSRGRFLIPLEAALRRMPAGRAGDPVVEIWASASIPYETIAATIYTVTEERPSRVALVALTESGPSLFEVDATVEEPQLTRGLVVGVSPNVITLARPRPGSILCPDCPPTLEVTTRIARNGTREWDELPQALDRAVAMLRARDPIVVRVDEITPLRDVARALAFARSSKHGAARPVALGTTGPMHY